MGDFGNIVGPILVAIGVFSALSAFRTWRQRHEVEGAQSWGVVAFAFAAVFLVGGAKITINYNNREAARLVPPPSVVVHHVEIIDVGSGTLSIALTVENKSTATPINSVNLLVTALDCPSGSISSACTAIRSQDYWLPLDTVPPGETRNISVSRAFRRDDTSSLVPVWQWELTQVNSQPPAD
jgi:hypothetical protein